MLRTLRLRRVAPLGRLRSLQILAQVPVRLKVGLEVIPTVDLEILTVCSRPFLFACDTSIMTLSDHHFKDFVLEGVLIEIQTCQVSGVHCPTVLRSID